MGLAIVLLPGMAINLTGRAGRRALLHPMPAVTLRENADPESHPSHLSWRHE